MRKEVFWGQLFLFFIHFGSCLSEVVQTFKHQGLISVPTDQIFWNVTRLNLQANQLQNISDYEFSSFARITKLLLDFNDISFLSSLAFAGLRIEQLYLSHNRINTFPDLRVISSTLAHLDMSDNGIGFIDPDFFNLTVLEIFDLSRNRLKLFNVSHKLDNLQTFDLSRNSLAELPAFTYTLPSLITLDLKHNKIRGTLDCKYYRKIPGVRHLFVSHNSISEISLCDLVQLRELQAKSNKLTEPPTVLNSSLPSLKRLYVGYNPLSNVSNEYFHQIPNLELLGLSGLRLTAWPDLQFLPLRDILLNGNHLSQVKTEDLMRYKYLRTIRLDDNRIKMLPDMIQVARASEATELTIELMDNKINCSSDNVCWLKQL